MKESCAFTARAKAQIPRVPPKIGGQGTEVEGQEGEKRHNFQTHQGCCPGRVGAKR